MLIKFIKLKVYQVQKLYELYELYELTTYNCPNLNSNIQISIQVLRFRVVAKTHRHSRINHFQCQTRWNHPQK